MKLKNYQYFRMMGFARSTAGEWLAGVSLTVVGILDRLVVGRLNLILGYFLKHQSTEPKYLTAILA